MDTVADIESELRLDLPCEPASARVARNAVAAVARRLGVAVEDVKIAVGEAVGNAVLHAYRGGGRGVIRVFARHQRGRLLVTVADDGVGMTPDPASPGLQLGIPLITQLCDDVRFSSSDRGTEVSMSFVVPTSAGA